MIGHRFIISRVVIRNYNREYRKRRESERDPDVEQPREDLQSNFYNWFLFAQKISRISPSSQALWMKYLIGSALDLWSRDKS